MMASDVPSAMSEQAIELENERLRASWNCFPAEHLAGYLAVDEQDQRINTHSILTRALLADSLWPRTYTALINEELRFGLVMSWLLEQLKGGVDRFQLLDDLGRPEASPAIPTLVRETAAWLQTPNCPLPDYVSDALMFVSPDQPRTTLFEPALNTFQGLWAAELDGAEAAPLRVLEPACGSANDYKAIRDCGLAAHIQYSGFDISWKNIRNARVQFPGVDFFEASVLNAGLPDQSFDYLFIHDMIGHLSGEGMERAVGEIMRMVRREAWIHCYNAADIPRHEIRPFERYHRNRISIPQMTASLEREGASVNVVVVSDLLKSKFGFAPAYTATSVSFLARRKT